MKKFLLILLTLLLISCEKDPLRYHPYDPNQPIQIQVDVYPMEDLKIGLSVFNNMKLETNADYFNIHGINVDFTLKENIPFPEELKNTTTIYIPPKKSDSKYKLDMYVIPYEYMEPGTAGYAIRSINAFIIGAPYLVGTTVPHEIGHVLSLKHYPEGDNVMYPLAQEGARGIPRIFLEKQIDTMLLTLETNQRVSLEAIIIN